MKKLVVIAVASVFLLSGCAAETTVSGDPTFSATQKTTSTPSAKPTASSMPQDNPSEDPAAGSGAHNSDGQGDPLARTTVVWGDYAAGTQADIDTLTAAGDCKSLDSQYGGAKANEATVRAESGHGAEAILAYIVEARALAGCN